MILAGLAVAALAIAAGMGWVCAVVAGWIHSGQFPQMGVAEAVQATVSPEFWSADPASAYPRDVARLLPGVWGFWSTAAIIVTFVAALVAAAAREIAERMAQTVTDRRFYHVFRGRRPQAFGRYRTVKDALVVDAPQPDRLIVGTIANPPALVATESAEYYDEAAQELAAPLLHAAALSATKTIVDVYSWVRDRDVETPAGILADMGAEDAP